MSVDFETIAKKLTSFEDFVRLLSNGDIKESLPIQEYSENTLFNFVDYTGKLHQVVIKYDSITNQIFPPESETSTVQRLDNIPNGCVKYIIGRADEDRYNLAVLNKDIQMYAIYDGHGGKGVSDYLRDHLPEKLAAALLDVDFNNEELMKKIITDVFIGIDAEMIKLGTYVGSTANVVLRKGSKLYLANIADSRAMIYDPNGQVLLETVDHDGENPDEIKRIENLGGRIRNGRVYGNLAVTRAFGDFHFKVTEDLGNYNPQGWVSVIPDIFVFNISQPNLTLLIASDGLWDEDYENSTVVASMILTLPQDLNSICNEIAIKGRQNYGSHQKDDITVILVRL
jgi:serine/threonine protein phosphatase PrpC